MALGKKLMNVNTTEKTSGTDRNEEKETTREPEKDTGRESEKDTAKEQGKTTAAEQGSLKDLLDSLADEEFIVTVPIGREEKENE